MNDYYLLSYTFFCLSNILSQIAKRSSKNFGFFSNFRSPPSLTPYYLTLPAVTALVLLPSPILIGSAAFDSTFTETFSSSTFFSGFGASFISTFGGSSSYFASSYLGAGSSILSVFFGESGALGVGGAPFFLFFLPPICDFKHDIFI